MLHLKIKNKIIDEPLIEILKTLKNELHNGKLKDIKVNGDNIQVTCPHHAEGREDHPSCGIYAGESKDGVEYGTFNCLACGIKGSFQRFIAECFDRNISWAEDWLIKRYGKDSDDISIQIDLKPISLNKKDNNKNYLDENILKTFQSWHPYLDKRHLDKKVCSLFKVCYDPRTEMIVFPVYDEKNKLYMLTKRSVKDKTFIIDAKKEKPVYLLNYIRNKNIKEVTIMESQINALTGWSFGVPSIATFGCNVTEHQIELLNKSGLNHVYIAFDGDAAGWKGTYKLIKHLRKSIIIDVIVFPFGKDVNDLTEDEFNKLTILSANQWVKTYLDYLKNNKN